MAEDELRAEVRGEIGSLRTEMRAFRRATHASFNAMRGDFADLHGEFGDLRAEMHAGFATAAAGQQIVGMLTTLIEQDRPDAD